VSFPERKETDGRYKKCCWNEKENSPHTHTHTRRSNKMSTLASAASKTKLYYIFKIQGGLEGEKQNKRKVGSRTDRATIVLYCINDEGQEVSRLLKRGARKK
jgi:hypothetical protein